MVSSQLPNTVLHYIRKLVDMCAESMRKKATDTSALKMTSIALSLILRLGHLLRFRVFHVALLVVMWGDLN
jgi:hypothetical protein